MKTKNILIAAVLSIVLLFAIGCRKDPGPTPTPTPIVVAPVITLSGVTTDTLNYGDSTSFSWKVTGTDVTVVLNGKAVSPSGTYSTGRLFANKDYKLFAINDGGSASKTFAIKVGDWTTSMYGIISHKHWIFGYLALNDSTTGYKWFIYPKGGTDPQFYTFAYYFRKSGMYELKNRYTGRIIADQDKWSLLNDTTMLLVGGKNYISFINKDSLFSYQKSMANNLDGTEYSVKIGILYIRDSTQ